MAAPATGPDGRRLKGRDKTFAKKQAMSRRALADLDGWLAGATRQAAE